MRTTAALVTAALLAAAPVHAQEPAAVRVVSVKETVLPKDAGAPALPDALAPWKELLEKVPGASQESDRRRLELAGASTLPVPPGGSQTYALPRDLQAIVSAKRRADGRYDVAVELTRPGKPPRKPEERERVVRYTLEFEDGATQLLRLQDAYAKGEHLLLLVTVAAKLPDQASKQ